MTLLENAFKYTSAPAHIWVQAGVAPLEAGAGGIAEQGFVVGDTGPGIPAADQPHIFERQYRGVQAQGAIAGTGLGLAIVQDLVASMAGRVEVYSPLTQWPGPLPDSLSPGERDRGTLFAVWLPLAGLP